jgi:hypothetical protein
LIAGLTQVTRGQNELGLAVDVVRGRRGCTGGKALRRNLTAATRRVLPALARAADQVARGAQGQLLPEDAVTFGLLVTQLDSGKPPAASAVQSELQALKARYPGMQSWRLAGFWTFWNVHIENIDWTRYHLDANLLLSQFQSYISWKLTAERNAINQSLQGIVGSEQAWEHALGDWQAIQSRWYTEEQASIAEYDASLQSYNAAKLITDTDLLLSGQG